MDNVKLDPHTLKAIRRMKLPADPVSEAQCSRCVKDCKVKNIRGECSFPDYKKKEDIDELS